MGSHQTMPYRMSTRPLALTALLILSQLACAFAGRVLSRTTDTPVPTLTRRPTSTLTPTNTKKPKRTQTPTPTVPTPLPSDTEFTFLPWSETPSATFDPFSTPSLTPSATTTITPPRPTAAPTETQPSPTITLAVEVLSNDYNAWKLGSVVLLEEMSFLGRTYTPQRYNRSPEDYLFLRMNFACLTGLSLIDAYTHTTTGWNVLSEPKGLIDVFFIDFSPDPGDPTQTIRRYLPVSLIGRCWVAATVPPDLTRVVLDFWGMHRLEPTMTIAAP